MRTNPNDRAIRDAVLQELAKEPFVGETEVGVEVDRGIVTLTGYVTTQAKRTAALNAAHRAKGVRDVANDILVHPPYSPFVTDSDVLRAARATLTYSPLAREPIELSVTGGMITIEGVVPSETLRVQAERLLREIRGARGVLNELRVRAPSSIET
jgi:osmotically-inducible protein OsmY